MEVTSSTAVSAPPKARTQERTQAVERNRAEEFRAEQERLQQRAQREEAGRKPEPVVNTQGQATGRLLNVKA